MLPCLRTCRYLPRRHGWTSRRTSSPCWLLGGGIPPWCSGSPWSRSFMWGHHLERYSNPPRCLPFDASHAQRSPVPGASDAWEGSGSPGLGLGRVVPLWSKPALHRRVHGMPIMPIRPPSTFWGCRWFAASWIEKRSRQHTLIGSSPAWPMTGMAFPGAMPPVFRTWQAGRRAWREPTRVGCPQAGQAELIQAGALLRHLLGATEIDEPFIPPYCLMCCCPTWSVCLSCDRSERLEGENSPAPVAHQPKED